MNCHLWGNEVDLDDGNTVQFYLELVLYSHMHCADELDRRFESMTCMSCGKTPQGLDSESCTECGDSYMAVTEERNFANF